MQLRKYMIFGQYVLTFSIVNAFIGPNVESVAEGEFPFIVGLVKLYTNIFGERHLVCTATLITERDVLTAAHCLEDEIVNAVGVIVGSVDITITPNNILIWWISFDKWASEIGISWKFTRNDISIGRLLHSMGKDWKIAKIKYMTNEELKGKHATGAGWGKTSLHSYPRILQKAKLEILSKRECERRIYKKIHEKRNFSLNYVCSVGDPHAVLKWGDSGGPLLYDNSIIAVNTATTPVMDDDHFYPDILNLSINIYFYRDYIKSILHVQ